MGGVLDSETNNLEVIGLSGSGFSYQAVSTTENGQEEIAGAILCTIHKKNEENAIYKVVFEKPMDEKFKKINDLTDYAKVLAAPTIEGVHQVTEYLEGVFLSVKESFSGQGIAKKLVTAMEEGARAKSVKLIYVGCSSEYTAKVLLRLGYTEVAAVKYAEYRHDNELVFGGVKPPHVAYKAMIKLLQ